MKRRALVLIGVAVAVGLVAAEESPAQNTWTGGGVTTLWSDAGNWSGPPASPTPPAVDAMLFFLGESGTASRNDAVQSVKARVVGTTNGIVFSNDGLPGRTAGFLLTGSAITLNGNIETMSATNSPAMSITDEIALDLVITNESFTQIYTRTYGSFAHNLTISGVISENGAPRTLRKGGTGGTLTLSGENVFLGQMQINVATVSVDRIENVGQPSPLGAGNLPVRLGTGALAGTLLYTGSGETNNRYFQIGSGPNTVATGGGVVTSNGSGPLVFTAAGRDPTHPDYANDRFNQNQGEVTSPGRSLTLNGTNSGANEIQTVIIDNVNTGGNLGFVSPVSLFKAGSGRWILSGSNTYSGTTTISNGVLQVGNSGTTGVLGTGPIVNNATLVYKRSDDVTLTAPIAGTGGFVQAGSGVLTFGTAQPYTGRTSVEAGTLSLGETGAVASSSSVTVSPGATFYVADVAGGVYAVPGGQTLGGGGTVVGVVSVAGGATLAPGMSPGTLGVTDAVTFGSGGRYAWQMLSATGTAGATAAWDLVDAGGVLSVTATPSDPFHIDLWSLSAIAPDVSGSASNFSPTQSYTWKIASAAGGISGFAADKFAINVSATNGTGGFANGLSGGTFSIAQSGNDLNLVFTSVGGPSVITISVPSGTQTQAQAGYPTLSGSIPVVKTGGGMLVLDQANPLTGSTTVQGGVLRLATGSALASSRLVVVAGGTGQVAPVTSTSVASLDLATGNGLLDLTSGALTISSGMTATELVAEILEGRGDGAWNGTSGITSSVTAAAVAGGTPRAVGWIDNGDGSLTTAYAAPGDTNIDWSIDILDASNFLAGGKFDSGSPAVWIEGDFSYDGVVDILDAADFFATGLYDAGIYNTASGVSGGVAAVPEPAAVWLVVSSLAVLAAARLHRGPRRETAP